MKIIFVCLLIFSSLRLLADCKVDGISDSPQKLHCQFPKIQSLELLCLNDTYILNWNNTSYPIILAFHLDVESGSSPLVFKGNSLKLTVVDHHAVLLTETLQLEGKCH
jgi:hypothetical protein